jgi:putative flippase GtrA
LSVQPRLDWARVFGRFSLAGVANSLVGYAVIFLSLWLGAGAVLANVLGYGVGLLLADQLNLRFVFRPGGAHRHRVWRFMAAFAIAYAANLVVLQVALAMGVGAGAAQLVAALPYLGAMFVLGKVWVYREVGP